MNSNRSPFLLFGIPLFVLGITSVLFRIFPWDIDWVTPFYDPATNSWPRADLQPWEALYHLGYFPAWVAALGGGLLAAAGCVNAALRRYRKIGLFLLLLLILGPGLVINAIFKELWERPRPSSIVDFGGEYAYEKVLSIDLSSPGDSFGSGHAAMGFYFMAFGFILASLGKRRAAIVAGFGGFIFGCLMGTARVVQGGHFPSDIVWSAGFIFLTAAALYRLFGMHKSPWYEPAANRE